MLWAADDLAVLDFKVHPLWVLGQQQRQLPLNQRADGLARCDLVLDLLGKLVAQFFQVDARQVHRQALCLVSAGLVSLDRLIDDALQRLQQFGDASIVALLG